MTLAAGDVVLAHAGTKPARPCVVLRVRPDGALVVVAGFDQPRDPCVKVEQGTQAWKAMRLDKTTCFHAKVECVKTAEPNGGRCPPEVFQRIRELVGDVKPRP